MLTGPGNVSIEKNVLKRELFPKAPKYSINEKENG
jgi:hypothetical protein